MSLKTKRHKMNAEHQTDNMWNHTNLSSMGKSTIDSVVETLNNNKLLIGSVAAACGGAVFLFATQYGKRVRDDIQTRAVEIYDSVSDQIIYGFDQVRDFANNILSHEQSEEMKDSER